MKGRDRIRPARNPRNETEDRPYVGIDPHDGQRAGRSGQLQGDLLAVIQIDVRIAERVDELAGNEPVTCAIIIVSSA